MRPLQDWHEEWQLDDGVRVGVRPIRPDDAALEQEFVHGLSQESRYNRFMAEIGELSPEMLVRFTRIDYPRDLALIVLYLEGEARMPGAPLHEREVAVARYVSLPGNASCEFALVVADAWQGRGIGYRLMQTLMRFARDGGLERMDGFVLTANHRMLELMQALGFAVRPSEEGPMVRLVTRAL